MHHTEEVPGQLDEGFSRPVESIMRCEDFKSNFARRLSNRYISRSPVTTKRQNSVKLRTSSKEIVDNVSFTVFLLYVFEDSKKLCYDNGVNSKTQLFCYLVL